jgi:hypothetical protein
MYLIHLACRLCLPATCPSSALLGRKAGCCRSFLKASSDSAIELLCSSCLLAESWASVGREKVVIGNCNALPKSDVLLRPRLQIAPALNMPFKSIAGGGKLAIGNPHATLSNHGLNHSDRVPACRSCLPGTCHSSASPGEERWSSLTYKRHPVTRRLRLSFTPKLMR